MFRTLTGIGLGWFLFTKTGRKVGKNICMNCIPYVEKELGIKILEPIKELTKEPENAKQTD